MGTTMQTPPPTDAGSEVFAEAPEVLDALAGAVAVTAASASRLDALRARLLDAATHEPFHVVRAAPEAFVPLLPGIRVRALRLDPVARTQTSLWRLDPGARIPAHPHHAEEECLVVQGDVTWDGERYGAGDYLLARPGAEHAPFVSEGGALLLIRSELTPELARAFGVA
jgi:anti-sigma factor ChrR (cupin superfamily)